MNDLAIRSGRDLTIPPANLTVPVPPAVSAYLRGMAAHAAEREAWAKAEEAARFRRSGDPDPREQVFVGTPPALPVLDDASRLMAEAALRGFDGALAAVTPEVLFLWLSPIAQVVRNPVPPSALAENVRALHGLIDDLPAGAFTEETRRALEADWFPSAGEIRRAVEPEAKRLQDMADLLRKVTRPPAPPPKPITPPPEESRPFVDPLSTPEGQAHIAALAAAFSMPKDGDGGPERIAGDKPKVKPHYIEGERLAALYEEQAKGARDPQAAAALLFRAEQIRKRLTDGKGARR
jgi:hypothetical protein